MVAGVLPQLTTLDTCDATTNWSSGMGQFSTDNEVQIQGSACLIGRTTNQVTYTDLTITTTDLTDSIIRVWVNCLTPGLLDLQENGGIGIRITDTSNNESEWWVGGSDTYVGGWVNFAVSTAATPDATTATAADPTLIDTISVRFDITAMVNRQNCLIDVVRYGPGLRVVGGTSGDPATFADILTGDQDSSNAFGCIAQVGSAYVYQGELIIGDATGGVDTIFRDTNQIVLFNDGSIFTQEEHKLRLEGANDCSTEVTLGTKVGEGASALGSEGVIFKGADTGRRFECIVTGEYVDNIQLYGCQFLSATGIFFGDDGTALGSSATGNYEIIDCVFSDTDRFDRNILGTGDLWLNNSILFSASTDPAMNILDNSGHDQSRFKIIAGLGLTSDELIITSQNYESNQNDQDFEISLSGQQWTLINPSFPTGDPYFEWTSGFGTIREEFELDLTLVNPDGDRIESGKIYIYEDTDQDFTLTGVTDDTGEFLGTILSRTWVDGAAGSSPTETEGQAFVRFKEGPIELDAVGRARFSQATLLGEYDAHYNTQSTEFYDYSTGGGTVTHDDSNGAFLFSCTTTGNDRATYITNLHHRDVNGQSQYIEVQNLVGTSKTNLKRQWGYGDLNDGVFFRQNGTSGEIEVIVISSTSGTPTITLQVPRTQWNGDRLDGSGGLNNLSLQTLDIDTVQTWWIDVRFSTARVRWGVIINNDRITCHTYLPGNSASAPMMRSASLPVYMEQENTGAVASSSEMRVYSAQVWTEGMFNDAGQPGNLYNSVYADTGGTVIASIRPAVTFGASGRRNHKVILPKIIHMHVVESGTNTEAGARFEFYRGHTLLGASFSSAGPLNSAEIDYSATGVSGGLVVGQNMARGHSRVDLTTIVDHQDPQRLVPNIDTGMDQPITTVVGYALSTGAPVQIDYMASWRELSD